MDSFDIWAHLGRPNQPHTADQQGPPRPEWKISQPIDSFKAIKNWPVDLLNARMDAMDRRLAQLEHDLDNVRSGLTSDYPLAAPSSSVKSIPRDAQPHHTRAKPSCPVLQVGTKLRAEFEQLKVGSLWKRVETINDTIADLERQVQQVEQVMESRRRRGAASRIR